MKRWAIIMLLLTLSACASLAPSPTTPREALAGLATSAAKGLLANPPWSPEQMSSTMVLMRPAEVDEVLPISGEALNEALGRALLSREDSPHVLDWVPGEFQHASDDQWLLEMRLSADSPALQLSDRILQPYRLRFDLVRPGDPDSRRQWQVTGAIDLDALPTSPLR